jgi:predicted RND superfamily exporter protein
MGMIMAVGVASANSILLVTHARDEQLAGKPALEAAVEAGVTRIRPVLMTATAMIVGMLPMAIGEPGGEQNAALARAVVGGLLLATPTTLLLVPYLFATLRKGADGKVASAEQTRDFVPAVLTAPIDARLRDEQVRPNLFLPLAQSLAYIEGQSLPAERGVRRQHQYRMRFLAQRFDKARSGH